MPWLHRMQQVSGGLEIGDLRGLVRSRPPPAAVDDGLGAEAGREDRSDQLKCPLPSANRLHMSSRETRGRAAARTGMGASYDSAFSPPRVDYHGCPAVCWETEL